MPVVVDEWGGDPDDFEPESTTPEIECRSCEAIYNIMLGDDFLDMEPRWCPFCGAVVVVKEESTTTEE